MARIGVALSGGGHRASMFSLGVLLYLAEARKSREVVTVASVSGGSLTNGYVAQAGAFNKMEPEEFRRVAACLFREIAERGTHWATWTTKLYVGALCVLAFIPFAVWLLPLHWGVRLCLAALAVCVLGAFASLRGRVCAWAFAATLFSAGGRPTRLASVAQSGLDHVFCATEVHAGEHLYFSGSFVCSYRFGWGAPGTLPLHAAVQASAAFPGAFPPVWLRARGFGFQAGAEPESRRAKYLVLADGGVYDNMADQWLDGLEERKKRWPALARELQEPEELVIVNSSAGMRWSSVKGFRLPCLGEWLSLQRVISVLYDNTTTTRRLRLVDRFDRAAQARGGLRGALVTIEQSPLKIPRFFLSQASAWPERAERARAVIQALEGAWVDWDDLVQKNCRVKTTLSALGREASLGLLLHGYATAMANLHVILGYPLSALPRLEELLGEAEAGGGRLGSRPCAVDCPAKDPQRGIAQHE